MHGAPYHRIVQTHGEEVSVRRRDSDTDQQYGSEVTYSSVGPRFLYIDGLSESEQPTGAGEFQSSMLIAFSLPDEDIQENDRFDHAGYTYEVDTKYPLQSDGREYVIRYECDRP